MSGKITVILLISVTIIFGIIFFYFQNFAYYSRVSNKEIIVVNNTQIKAVCTKYSDVINLNLTLTVTRHFSLMVHNNNKQFQLDLNSLVARVPFN